MKISEIFLSINGEGKFAGAPTIFVRVHGCNLRCSYCDSMYAVEGTDYTDMTVDDILEEVKLLSCNRVTLTGGEPLLQKDAIDLINVLIFNRYEVEIETNGAVDILNYVGSNTTITMDWKCPSSGMVDRMNQRNLAMLRSSDVLKFVVGSLEDLHEMKRVSKQTQAQIFVSPVFGNIEPKDIVQYVLDNELYNVRVQLQLHKYIWDPDMKGV